MKKFFALTKVRQGGDVSCLKARRAFTLVEVVLALGIVSFALLSLVALLPVGMQATKDSLEESEAVNVLSNVIADRKATDPTLISVLYKMPTLTATSSNSFGITASNSATTDFSQSQYRVTYEVIPVDATSKNPYQVRFKVSWPAPAKVENAAGYVEAVVTFPHP